MRLAAGVCIHLYYSLTEITNTPSKKAKNPAHGGVSVVDQGAD
jgi:hypothetical protein